jgi:demethylmenaquinone methyltransferase/2-methoxy-6-polyprenyl-1,4-benzoquinol methylase
MSNENQKPTFSTEQASRSDNNNPFLNEPLPQGTPQGQQQSLQQGFTDSQSHHVPKYNLPRGAIQVTSVKLHTSAIKP